MRRRKALLLVGPELPVCVATDEPDAITEPAEAFQRFRRPRTGSDIAADEDQVRVDFRKDGFERRQIPMDVVEGGDLHLIDDLELHATPFACAARAHDRAQRASDAALPA